MSAVASGFDPLIAEAKLRIRRRRVSTAVLVLLTTAAVLFLILRPSGAPGTSRVTSHGGNDSVSGLAHIRVPVDATEREWRAGIRLLVPDCACGITSQGVTRLHDKVVRVVGKTGAAVVRIKVWQPSGEVEVVLATRMNPAEYLVHRARLLVNLLGHGYPYVKVVNARGARIFEWYRLPRQGGVGFPRRLTNCSPVAVSPMVLTPPCPAK